MVAPAAQRVPRRACEFRSPGQGRVHFGTVGIPVQELVGQIEGALLTAEPDCRIDGQVQDFIVADKGGILLKNDVGDGKGFAVALEGMLPGKSEKQPLGLLEIRAGQLVRAGFGLSAGAASRNTGQPTQAQQNEEQKDRRPSSLQEPHHGSLLLNFKTG